MINLVIDELERHFNYWSFSHEKTEALSACANVIEDPLNAFRLVFLSIPFAKLDEENIFGNGHRDLINSAINMKSGRVLKGLLTLVCKFEEKNLAYPDLLEPTLKLFALKKNFAIRALMLRHLPYLQSKNYELGWSLFEIVMETSKGLWKAAETCLYYSYQKNFDLISTLLSRILEEGEGEDFETWGRISALSALSGYIDILDFIEDLTSLNSLEAWKGAATVLANVNNYKNHNRKCSIGLEAGLNAGLEFSNVVAEEIKHLCDKDNSILIPLKLIKLCFEIYKNNDQKKNWPFFGFDKWLNSILDLNPDEALDIAEIYLNYVKETKSYLYDYDDVLVQFLTRIFAEAEEREDSDNSEMLYRVVSLQDTLLTLGVDSVDKWLKNAERP